MSFFELFLTAFALSMDAFAVSVCKGLATKNVRARHYLCVGLWFGAFQALMPLIGYFLGSLFQKYITAFDHWIAFILLALIGINMIREAVSGEEDPQNDNFGFRTMFVMAVATSIDALAVGVTYALLPDINIFFAILFIGVTTCLLSALGLFIGKIFGSRFGAKAELAGGVILVLMGVKILLEHMGWLPF